MAQAKLRLTGEPGQLLQGLAGAAIALLVALGATGLIYAVDWLTKGP